MTLLDPTTGRRRGRSTSTSGSTATRIKQVWAGVWLLGVPLLVSAYVHQQVGDAWGSIPAFWLDGDPAGPPIVGVLTLVVALAICIVLHRLRADVLLGVIPAVGWLVGGWLGLLAGLALGGIAFAVRRRQGH